MAKSKYTTLGGNFKTDGESIFYDRKLLTWANLKTFKYLWWDFAKDGVSIYCKSKKMVWVDSGTFEVIGSAYWRDKSSVFYLWNTLDWADASTFEEIPNEEARDYAMDKNTVYLDGEKLEWSDPNTFEVILSQSEYFDSLYSKDKNHLYDWCVIIEGVNPEGFKMLDDHYAYNGESVYYDGSKIEGTNPKTFTFLNGERENNEWLYGPYARDKDRVFYENVLIEWADAESFCDHWNRLASDKSRVYIWSHQVEWIDIDTFQVCESEYFEDEDYDTMGDYGLDCNWYWDNSYFMDKRRVFVNGEILKWAKPKDFGYEEG